MKGAFFIILFLTALMGFRAETHKPKVNADGFIPVSELSDNAHVQAMIKLSTIPVAGIDVGKENSLEVFEVTNGVTMLKGAVYEKAVAGKYYKPFMFNCTIVCHCCWEDPNSNIPYCFVGGASVCFMRQGCCL